MFGCTYVEINDCTYIRNTACTYDIMTVCTYYKKGLTMDNRRRNMQRYNAIRSARVEAMIDMINAIDHGGNELDVLGVYDSYRLERQVNSYRAMQIAQYFGVNVSKGKLTRFSKPKDHQYDFTASQLLEYISEHYDAFMNYWEWFKQPAVLEAKRKHPTH